ncbi:uncharacterized protein M421DRAFT_152250 [Didymella exigua CBS 183.55]|uniref:Uncharacterized protein n=1 Tax=Didymella exigua CBS 183.55 TaxID=1150837 RepID=A0A6A5RNS1_9PLEO|nr:uncharacterized protein M421DRAFT_152250 [Didymella exigua CBS 183.55]KAF1928674.1 hypothetical protein M421DRAFT_152250 [Didymella exigua CBS 183.55]
MILPSAGHIFTDDQASTRLWLVDRGCFLRRFFLPRAFEALPRARCTIHAQMKHQDRTRTVADLPGSPSPAHFGTQYKRSFQCLAMVKLLDGAPGGLRGPPVASFTVRAAHISIFPNPRRLGMRLGTKLSPDGCLQTFGDPSRLSRGRKVRLRPASSSVSPNGMTFDAKSVFGSLATSRLYILVLGPLPKDQNCRSFASTSYSNI